MAGHRLLTRPSAAKEIEAAGIKRDRQRIVGRIQSLAADPRPPGSEKLAGPAALFRVRQGDYRVIYVVDDAHRLDDLSAFVVNQIVQRRTAQVILTLPDGEPIPPAVQEITEAGRFTRVDLPTLSPAETEMLLSAALDSAIDPDAASNRAIAAAAPRELRSAPCMRSSTAAGASFAANSPNIRTASAEARAASGPWPNPSLTNSEPAA